MVRGFYTAASGMLSRQRAINVISNNIANAGTAGYKNQLTVESSFGEHYVARINSLNDVPDKNIGTSAYIVVNQDEFSDMTQGAFQDTGRSLDLAINGSGFYLVESATDGEVLTRNGQFELDAERYLTLAGVGKVLNENREPIQLQTSDFTVNSKGVIFEDGEEADTLFVAVPKEGESIKIKGNGIYKTDSGDAEQAAVETYGIRQGFIEKSNINISQEMTKIMSNQNHFQSCVQILKMYDKINEISANQIGRLG
ncbi:MAG: flagellar hook-basal body protein [Eubacteriales bacterium]|nr:flagellar hook-basal body protein [Eubacteriales bacterium]MDD3349966.1 flagellar hook-basal body protein [Eubacteriales bacterium]